MKKPLIFLLITLTLFSLKTHANSSDKKHYISADIGVKILISPSPRLFSLRYGRNLYSKAGAYLGFVETAGTLGVNFSQEDAIELASLSLGYGWEFMRDKKFSFGLLYFGGWGTAPGIKQWVNSSIGGFGLFASTKITEKWSVLLRTELAGGEGGFSILSFPSAVLGARYHF